MFSHTPPGIICARPRVSTAFEKWRPEATEATQRLHAGEEQSGLLLITIVPAALVVLDRTDTDERDSEKTTS